MKVIFYIVIRVLQKCGFTPFWRVIRVTGNPEEPTVRLLVCDSFECLTLPNGYFSKTSIWKLCKNNFERSVVYYGCSLVSKRP